MVDAQSEFAATALDRVRTFDGRIAPAPAQLGSASAPVPSAGRSVGWRRWVVIGALALLLVVGSAALGFVLRGWL